jgi:hypothetical protein
LPENLLLELRGGGDFDFLALILHQGSGILTEIQIKAIPRSVNEVDVGPLPEHAEMTLERWQGLHPRERVLLHSGASRLLNAAA